MDKFDSLHLQPVSKDVFGWMFENEIGTEKDAQGNISEVCDIIKNGHLLSSDSEKVNFNF